MAQDTKIRLLSLVRLTGVELQFIEVVDQLLAVGFHRHYIRTPLQGT